MAVSAPHRSPNARRASAASIGLRAAATLGAVALLSSDEGVVLCPFRRSTHGYCPLCGGTRAAGDLLTGDLAASWRTHPLVLLLGLQVIAIGAWLAATRPSGPRLGELRQRWQTPLALANLAVAVVVWGVRLASGAIPAPTGLYAPLPLP